MAFSQATLIRRIRDILGDTPRGDLNAADPTTGTTVTVADSTIYNNGDIIEFQDDGEQCFVRSNNGATTMTVIRGYNGTTAATSHATNVVILKNPTFGYIEIVNAIERGLHNLWPTVYRKYQVTIAAATLAAATDNYYDLDTTIEDLISVNQLSSDSLSLKQYGGRGGSHPATIVRDVPTGLASSGVALYLPRVYNTGQNITVTGSARIDDTTSGGNYSHFSEGVEVDCIAYYAVSELVAAKDIMRVSASDVSMAEQTVGAGERSRIGEFWREKAERAKRRWEMDLRREIPVMRKHFHRKLGTLGTR